LIEYRGPPFDQILRLVPVLAFCPLSMKYERCQSGFTQRVALDVVLRKASCDMTTQRPSLPGSFIQSAMGSTSDASSSGTSTQLQTFLQSLASNLQQQGASSASGMFVNTAA
jgi:hypothetical protein